MQAVGWGEVSNLLLQQRSPHRRQRLPLGQMTWYTSSHSLAQHYYCELDPQWRNLSLLHPRSYPLKQQSLGDLTGERTKHPDSRC
jgi:hypothetical protein